MRKKGLFGVIGIVLFLFVVFVILGLSLWGKINLLAFGDEPKININAIVTSSNYTNDCEIFLMGILRFRDAHTDLTYGEMMSLAKRRGAGLNLSRRIEETISQDILSRNLDCIEIIAQGDSDEEPFIQYYPYGHCKEKLHLDYCEAYVPDMIPEEGYIRVQFAMVAT